MNLLESYKGRLAISEKYYAQKNSGEDLLLVKSTTLRRILAKRWATARRC